MDLKEIKQIVELMKRSNLTEFEIEEEGLKLRLSRQTVEDANGHGTPVAYMPNPTMPPFPMPASPPATPGAEAPAMAEPEGQTIKSPMVGTFYAAPSPDSDPFASVGSKIAPDTTVCIIEAMKVMNEIKAELAGTVTEVLVQNGESVEYGQPLFRVS